MGRTIMQFLLMLGMALVLLTACGGDGGGQDAPDYGGRWYLAIGHDPRYILDIQLVGRSSDFSIVGPNIDISGSADLSGDSMTFRADIPGFGEFIGLIDFQPGGADFSGAWILDGTNYGEGTLAGQRDAWPTFDVEQLGVPQFAGSDCIEQSKILRISRFRSGMGHDYSDDFESCRSMKHYFLPKDTADISTIEIYSPVNGIVLGTTDEFEGRDLWKGTAVGIRPDGYPAFCVIIFHIDLDTQLEAGDRVVSGQKLGTSAKLDGTAADIAFVVHTPGGNKLVSWFDVMTAGVFDIYFRRGVPSRSEGIITKAERDADPLTCNGEQFEDDGNLANWMTLF